MLHSLMARVYKARYYPTSSYFDAKLGSNPSYIWRGMLEVQSLLKEGCRRSIGDDATTVIGNDPWLTDASNPYVTSTLHDSIAQAPVSSLISMHGTQWDHECVRDIFNTRDAELILNLPLSVRKPPDAWIWEPDSKGKYTVKSCYRKLLGEFIDQKPWTKLWNMQVETASHLFMDCNETRRFWNAVGLPIAYYGNSVLTEWFFGNIVKLNGDDLCKFAMFCWGLWYNRNDYVWNGVPYVMAQVIHSALSLWLAWKGVNEGQVVQSMHDIRTERWSPPSQGRLKLNTDVAMSMNNSCMGMGWVIRDAQGHFVTAKAKKFDGFFSVKEAEAVSIREALSWIKEMDIGDVDIKTDSQLVFYALSSEPFNNSFGFLIDDVKEAASQIHDVVFCFVRRSANRAAHALAREAVSESSCGEWLISPPLFLVNIIASDLMI
ncbi:uncharacterized protein LOC116020169 [Ipomoea triloba]|uniref:uncharacterized protein LOC116020169 n=1 Tax=Ipomoea triloba TaxID=35885 RepID=UPI00125E939E|nr:uncharacterized protein LOC116020169 [Ipomoea triloba]